MSLPDAMHMQVSLLLTDNFRHATEENNLQCILEQLSLCHTL